MPGIRMLDGPHRRAVRRGRYVLGQDVRSTVSGQEQAATDLVKDVASKTRTYGVEKAVWHIEHGAPIEMIPEVIESERYSRRRDETTGRRGADRILVGSVAEKTVRSAPVPVITVS
jgi:nucleotide-binding universal stress UspA family protein